jgi:hypothetical protein
MTSIKIYKLNKNPKKKQIESLQKAQDNKIKTNTRQQDQNQQF